MRYNQLGRTGLFVSELCLGTMTFGGDAQSMWGRIGQLAQADADRLVGDAVAGDWAVGVGESFVDRGQRGVDHLGVQLDQVGDLRAGPHLPVLAGTP